MVELWNYLLEDLELLQLNSVLLIVSIIKHYEEELLKTKRLVEFARVLESKTITKVQSVRAAVQMLKEKYFGEVRGILAEIKNMFNDKPLEVVLSEYYKQQTAIKEKRKTRRMAEKKVTLRKVNKQIDIDFPEYPNQKYTLHIFFKKLPETAGSLTIRCNEVEY